MENVEGGARNIYPAEVVGRLLQKSRPIDIPGNMTTMNYGDMVIVDEGGHMNLHTVLTPPAEDVSDLFCITSTYRDQDDGVYPADNCRLIQHDGRYHYQKPDGSFVILPKTEDATYVRLPDDRFGAIREESDFAYEEKMRRMRAVGALSIISSSMLLAGTAALNHIMELRSGPETAIFVAGLSAIAAVRLFGKIDKEFSEHERELSKRFQEEYESFLEEIGIDPDIIRLTNSL